MFSENLPGKCLHLRPNTPGRSLRLRGSLIVTVLRHRWSPDFPVPSLIPTPRRVVVAVSTLSPLFYGVRREKGGNPEGVRLELTYGPCSLLTPTSCSDG